RVLRRAALEPRALVCQAREGIRIAQYLCDGVRSLRALLRSPHGRALRRQQGRGCASTWRLVRDGEEQDGRARELARRDRSARGVRGRVAGQMRRFDDSSDARLQTKAVPTAYQPPSSPVNG